MSQGPIRSLRDGYRLIDSLGWTPQRFLRRQRYPDAPRIVCTSVPRAGKGLLVGLMCRHPAFRRVLAATAYDRTVGDPARLANALDRLRPGQILGSHLRHSDALATVLAARRDVRHLIIVRDPRDIAVSIVLSVLGQPRHYLHELFARPATMAERLVIAIKGSPSQGYDPLAQRLAAGAGWLAGASHVIRFESLLREGSASRRESLVRLFAAVGVNVESNDMRRIEASLDRDRPAGVYWRDYFDDDLRALFKQEVGAELIRYGYEKGVEW